MLYFVVLKDTRYKFLFAMMYVEHYQCHMPIDETSLLFTVLMNRTDAVCSEINFILPVFQTILPNMIWKFYMLRFHVGRPCVC